MSLIERSFREKIVLVGVALGGASLADTEDHLDELALLVDTAGADEVARIVQKRDSADPATLIGAGKVAELRELSLAVDADTIVFDAELTPAQSRNLEKLLGRTAIDRTAVILDIFVQHARTREGKAQVELAQLRYRLPRLRGKGKTLSQQAGGIGTRGPGETQLEVDRRRLVRRMTKLETDLKSVARTRRVQLKARARSRLSTVSLVGYTNAGKSTLLNALTGASVRAEHRLFATLDPTTRRLDLPAGRGLLLTDTVGFIQKLPTDLVAAFRATLEEVTEADLVIQVLDASSPAVEEQASTVDEELATLGAGDKPRVVALNKVDLLGPSARRRVVGSLSARYPGLVPISATQGLGLEGLQEAIDAASRGEMVGVEILVPYGSERVLASLRKIGGIERTEYVDAGTRAWGWAPRHAAGRFEPYSVLSGTNGSRRGRRRPS